MFKKIKSNGGFTLVEMFTTFSILMILTGSVVLYGRVGKEQMILFQDQSRIIANFNRAKFLAFQAYKRDYDKDCGYGIHFQAPNNFIIYHDKKEVGVNDCSVSGHNFEFSGDDEKIFNFQLNPLVKVRNFNFTSAIFVPPDFELIIKNNGVGLEEGELELTTAGESSFVKISINEYGQISSK